MYVFPEKIKKVWYCMLLKVYCNNTSPRSAQKRSWQKFSNFPWNAFLVFVLGKWFFKINKVNLLKFGRPVSEVPFFKKLVMMVFYQLVTLSQFIMCFGMSQICFCLTRLLKLQVLNNSLHQVSIEPGLKHCIWL